MVNWITKALSIGEKIKKNLKKKFPTKKEQLESPWISCCKGPVLRSTIFNSETLNTCPDCSKHYPLRLKKGLLIFIPRVIMKLLTPLNQMIIL